MLKVLDLKYNLKQFLLSARSKVVEYDTKLYNESSKRVLRKLLFHILEMEDDFIEIP